LRYNEGVIKIAPSILSADFGVLAEEIARIEAAGADQVHVEPDRYLAEFAARGADMLTVHVEACAHLQRTLVGIRELAGKRGAPVKAGAALNPATHPAVLDYVLDDLDLVLVMSVNPGFGGQALIPAVYPKIRQIRTQLARRRVDVSIDGGVKVEHARPLAEHGASILVAGSAVFEANDPAAVIEQMRAAAAG
jgi:ribulose-phosphate 3-epimerase